MPKVAISIDLDALLAQGDAAPEDGDKPPSPRKHRVIRDKWDYFAWREDLEAELTTLRKRKA